MFGDAIIIIRANNPSFLREIIKFSGFLETDIPNLRYSCMVTCNLYVCLSIPRRIHGGGYIVGRGPTFTSGHAQLVDTKFNAEDSTKKDNGGV